MRSIHRLKMMKTNKDYSAINGILLLNKSQGITSNKALQKVKRLYNAAKAGHSGSLDPLATGMLPVCFGEATKICQYLLDANKCYETTGLLGIKTDTSDATGKVISCIDSFQINEDALRGALSSHTGKIAQIPSMFSALKHNGTPLYRFAREGIEIERKAREIVISELVLNSFNGTEFSLSVSCSKGTYIRNLVEDIGDALGVGAHVTQLHRVSTAGFIEDAMYTLEQLEEMTLQQRLDCLIPMDKAVDYLNAIFLSDDEALAIRQGRIVGGKDVGIEGDCVRLYDNQSQFIGVGILLVNGDLKAKRLVSFHF